MMSRTDRKPRSYLLLAISLAILLGVIPMGVYAVTFGSVPAVHPAAAIEILAESGEGAILVDVRSEGEYLQRHISDSVSVPIEQLTDSDAPGDLPEALQGRTLLLVSDVGIRSAQAVRKLNGIGVKSFNIRGGMQDWGRAWSRFPESPFSTFRTLGGAPEEPFREMSLGEQGAAAAAMLWIKPTYMLLSGLVSILLLRSQAADLRLLGWGLLVFLVGEVACAINYAFLRDNSYLAEYIHSYSMALAFGITAFALLEGLDQRLLHLREDGKPCALLPVCGPCARYQPIPCNIRRLAQLAGVTMLVLGFIPLLASLNFQAYNTHIGPVNHYYLRPFVHQWVEARYSPAVGILLSGLGLLVIALTPKHAIHPLARGMLCGGFGFLGFGFFRVSLGLMYADRLIWATFWEEATELTFVLAVIFILWTFIWRGEHRSIKDVLKAWLET